jgi:hypothetical protein
MKKQWIITFIIDSEGCERGENNDFFADFAEKRAEICTV